MCNVLYELEGFIVMSVHVPREEVEDRHVHQVEQSTTGIIWRSCTNLEEKKNIRYFIAFSDLQSDSDTISQ